MYSAVSEHLSCLVCLSTFKNFQELKLHINANCHQQKMNEVFQKEPDGFYNKLPNIVIMDRDIRQNIHQRCIGVRLLTVCFTPSVAHVFYLCHSCKEMLRDTKILSHLTSVCHKFNYCNYIDPNRLGFSWIPNKDLWVDLPKHERSHQSGPIQMLDLPENLFGLYKTYTYSQVVHSLSEFDKLPKLLEVVKPKRVTMQEYQTDTHRRYPLLGMQHLVECICKGQTERTYYLCTLCKLTLAAHTVIKHILSFDHIYSFFKAWHPSTLVSNQCYRDYSEGFMSMMLNLAKQAEKLQGPARANMKRLSLEPDIFVSVNFHSYEDALNKLESIAKKKDGSSLKTCIKPAGKLDISAVPHTIRCQNCDYSFQLADLYFQHVQTEKHKTVMKKLWSQEQSTNACNHNAMATSAEDQKPHQDLFSERLLDSAADTSQVVICYSTEAKEATPICVCFVCEDAFPKSLLPNHLSSPKHLIQTLLYLNPLRLPFGWQEVPGQKFLKSMVAMEVSEREWCQKIIQVLDLPASVLSSLSSSSYKTVLERLKPDHAAVLQHKVAPCQVLSEHNNFPLLGCEFLVMHDSYDQSREVTVASCLLCRKRLSDTECFAHIFSSEHVKMFLGKFLPGSLTSSCDRTILLDLARKAAHLHGVSHIQKVKFKRPIKEPCDFYKDAKRKEDKGDFLPAVIPRQTLVPKETPISKNWKIATPPQKPPDNSQNKHLQKSVGSKSGTPDKGCIVKAAEVSKKTEEQTSKEKPKSSHIPAKVEPKQEQSEDVQMSASQGGNQKRLRMTQETIVLDNAIAHKRRRLNSNENASCEETLKMGTTTVKKEAVQTVISEAQQDIKQENTLKSEPQNAHVTFFVQPDPNITFKTTSGTKLTTLTKMTTSKLPTPAAGTFRFTTSQSTKLTDATALTANVHQTLPSSTMFTESKPNLRGHDSSSNNYPTSTLNGVKTNQSSVLATISKSIASTTKTSAPSTVCGAESTASAAASSKFTATATNTTKPTSKFTVATTSTTKPTTRCTTKPSRAVTTPSAMTTTSKSGTISKFTSLPTSCTITPNVTATTIMSATTYKCTAPASATKLTASIASCASTNSSSISKAPSTVFLSLHKAPKDRTETVVLSAEALPVHRSVQEVTCETAHRARRCSENTSCTRVNLGASSGENVHLKSTGGSNVEAQPSLQRCNPHAGPASTAKPLFCNVKPTGTVPKIGLSYIIVVTSDGRKQSYCTLCRIRLERSSHPMENIHQYNYVKLRFPELSDEQLAGINLEKFGVCMAEVEKCLGQRYIQTRKVTNGQYNELSGLPEAEALYRLENHFCVSSSSSSGTSLVLRRPFSSTSSQDVSSPEYDSQQDKFEDIMEADTENNKALHPTCFFLLEHALDMEAVHASDAVPFTDLDPTRATKSMMEIDTSGCRQQQEIAERDCGYTDTIPESCNSRLTSVFLASASVTTEKRNLEGLNRNSPSILLQLDPLPATVTTEQHNLEEQRSLEDSNGHSPSVLLDLNPPPVSVTTEQRNLEGSNGHSPSVLLELSPPPASVTTEQQFLEGSNRRSPSALLELDPPRASDTKVCNPVGSCQNADRQTSMQKASKDPESNLGCSDPQVPVFSGKASNLSTFLWVRGPYNQPIVGLASVYECRGKAGDSLYLCESCSQKLSVSDICQHVFGREHQLKYILKNYPQFMDTFWDDKDLPEDKKIDLLKDVAHRVSQQEHFKKMDAKVCFLFQDLYDYVLTAPFSKALDALQNGKKQSLVCKPIVTSQLKGSQKSKEQIGHLNVSGVASAEPSHSAASMSLQHQENHRSSLSSPIPKTPVCQVKDELIPSEFRSPGPSGYISKSPPIFKVKDKLTLSSRSCVPPGVVSKTPPSFQVKDELTPSESKCPVTPGVLSKTPPSLQVKDELISSESRCHITCGAIAKTPRSFQVKDELIHSKSRRPVTPGVIFKTPPSLEVKDGLIPSKSRCPVTPHGVISKTPPSLQVKDELFTEGRVPVSADSLAKTPPIFHVKDEPSVSRSRSLSMSAPISRTPSGTQQAKDELVFSESRSPISGAPISKTLPQLKNEQMFAEPVVNRDLDKRFKTLPNAQVKDETMVSDCRSPANIGPVPKILPISQVKSELVLMACGSPVSAVPISKASPKVQQKSESTLSEFRSIPIVEKLSSSNSPITVGSAIRQDEYLLTRKRKGNQSLGELRTYTNKTQVDDPQPAKYTRNSIVHSLWDITPGVQEASVVNILKSDTKLDSKEHIAGITDNSVTKPSDTTSNMWCSMSVQTIATSFKSESRSSTSFKIKTNPSTTSEPYKQDSGHIEPGSPSQEHKFVREKPLALLEGFEYKNLLGDACVRTEPKFAPIPQSQGSTDRTEGSLHQSTVSANGVDMESNHELIDTIASPTETRLSDLGGCKSNPAAGCTVPNNDNTTCERLNPNEASKELPVQIYDFTIPLAMGWMNPQMQQWVEQQKQQQWVEQQKQQLWVEQQKQQQWVLQQQQLQQQQWVQQQQQQWELQQQQQQLQQQQQWVQQQLQQQQLVQQWVEQQQYST
ncbi:uncharacterized protein LOC133650251 isoform X3 [Entelurus aequoreus]|uniref:uncharacterized protein LOC133650251 isoform X3 n=1 Tax=Entelurus aequoreus TaxID=161455 RepID=UPI002B1CF1C0|nr:uncharacterized protein LOC133650251 isoform X3 [Entelurus aequoreus]